VHTHLPSSGATKLGAQSARIDVPFFFQIERNDL